MEIILLLLLLVSIGLSAVQINDTGKLRQEVLDLKRSLSRFAADDRATTARESLSQTTTGEKRSVSGTPASAVTTPSTTTTSSKRASRPPMPPPDSAVSQTAFSAVFATQATAVTTVNGSQTKDAKSVESWVGRNVVGIVAAVLVFLGLIFLGILVVPSITDSIKILFLYIFSAVLTGTGYFLTEKRKNNFTTVLLGCGCGSFFISIMLTHLYFHALGDIAAFSLLLVWMAASLLIARRTESVLVSIITHLGMIVSICTGYIGGISDDKVILLLCYQFASTAIIVGGNILCCKKTYRFGLFASLALTNIASWIMWSYFLGDTAQFASALPPGVIAGAFIVQFLAASFLSYLLFVSTVRVKNAAYRPILQACNKILWVLSLFTNVFLLIAKLFFVVTNPENLYLGVESNYGALLLPTLVTLLLLFGHAAFTVFLRSRLSFDERIEAVSIVIVGVSATVLLFVHYALVGFYAFVVPHLTGILLVAIMFMIISHITKKGYYYVLANVLLGVDAMFMLLSGYHELTAYATIAAPLIYMIVYFGLIIVQYRQLGEEKRARYLLLFKFFSLLFVELSLVVIFAFSDLSYRVPILLLCLLVLLLLVHHLKLDERSAVSLPFHYTVRINEFMVFLTSAFFIATDRQEQFFAPLYLGVAFLSFVLLALRLKEAAAAGRKGENTSLELASGICITVLILAVIEGNTNWFDEAYVFSFACMLVALACIVFGFTSRIAIMRLYGLVLVMLCVLKLVSFDIGDLNSTMRVIAFIGGGLICFAISAIYNYAVGRFDKENSKS